MGEEYRLKCTKCGHEFDVNYRKFNSFSDPEEGIIWRERTPLHPQMPGMP